MQNINQQIYAGILYKSQHKHFLSEKKNIPFDFIIYPIWLLLYQNLSNVIKVSFSCSTENHTMIMPFDFITYPIWLIFQHKISNAIKVSFSCYSKTFQHMPRLELLFFFLISKSYLRLREGLKNKKKKKKRSSKSLDAQF